MANGVSKMLLQMVWIAIIAAAFAAHADDRGPQLVAKVRQELRQQGFKTDLSDFNFSTSPEMRAREAILKAAVPEQTSGPSPFQINLMETVGTNSAIILWKQDRLKLQYRTWPENKDEMSWQSLGKMLNENRSALDAACVAAMSGPIAFNLNASAGNAILLPHLAVLKILEQTLGCRTLLDLHDGNLDAAWTNLMAATRLVTAWQVEPVKISDLVRFNNTTLAYNATWQALQTTGWSDEQLDRLQHEWESVNFFTNLPETIAFERASYLSACRKRRQEVSEFKLPFKQFFIVSLQSPREIWHQMQEGWWALQDRQSYDQYRRYGMYDDETNLLLFYRNREIEVRNAIQAPTWMQMRELPGVTNRIFFHSKYGSPMLSMLNLHEITMASMSRGTTWLGHAAEAEARRRILITAIALERFREKHGSYPNNLTELAPEFMKKLLVDFMDGQPLRYRLADDGHFILYSVGLNCVDNGGVIRTREERIKFREDPHALAIRPEADLVWPLPASPAEVKFQMRDEKDSEE